jgi:hypothetical protein
MYTRESSRVRLDGCDKYQPVTHLMLKTSSDTPAAAGSGTKPRASRRDTNDSAVIARIPNPRVGRMDRVIASEVATMEFVRALELLLDVTTLTRSRQGESSASRFRRFCPGVELNQMLSTPLTFSWSTPEAQSLAKCGRTWKLTRKWLSLTK